METVGKFVFSVETAGELLLTAKLSRGKSKGERGLFAISLKEYKIQIWKPRNNYIPVLNFVRDQFPNYALSIQTSCSRFRGSPF
jgi:hypothetical protein